MKPLHLPAVALVAALVLTACGDDGGDDPTVAAPSASPLVCPFTTTEVPAPAGSTTDLATKPVIAPNPAPAPEGIVYADIVEGDGEEVVAGSSMSLKYVGALYADGTEFDSSWSRGPDEVLGGQPGMEVRACFQGLVSGFAVGPIGMKVGGRRQITFPAPFGYGEMGQPPDIPGGAALSFVVDLVMAGPPPEVPPAGGPAPG